jgi:hypothetical protein
MCKYVLIALVVVVVLLMATGALVVQLYGWPGFLVFCGALVLFGYVARKILPRLLFGLMTRSLRQMGAALRGARIAVHSVTPSEAPPPEYDSEFDPRYDSGSDDGERPAITDRPATDRSSDEDDDGIEDAEVEVAGPLDWYWIELTVVPPDAGSSEGRIVHRRAWSPQLIGAVGPRPPLRFANAFASWSPLEQFPGSVQHVTTEVWTGTGYETPEEQQVYGELRLRLRVGVTRDVRAVTVTYAQFTDIGEVPLPRIDVSPGQGP